MVMSSVAMAQDAMPADASADTMVISPAPHNEQSFGESLHAAEDMTAEVEGHHGADTHAKSGGLPQFDITTFPSQLFWLAVAFVVMYFTFSTRALPAISSVLENRREHVQNDLETAERMRNEAETVQNNYENGLQSARNEASNLLNGTIAAVKQQAEDANNKLRQRGETELAALEARLAEGTAAARNDMDTIAAEVAHLAAEKIFGISTDIKKAKTVVQSINAREAA
ncbi:MAG: hypothetical protein KKA05_02845 [Alphaproteobacteria bacterium]|nr:hypothetical protein [Alphaproteobacteria bacterium]